MRNRQTMNLPPRWLRNQPASPALPMAVPPAAAKKLRRAVKDLKFVGALVDSHLESGEYYDDKRFLPVFEAA